MHYIHKYNASVFISTSDFFQMDEKKVCVCVGGGGFSRSLEKFWKITDQYQYQQAQ